MIERRAWLLLALCVSSFGCSKTILDAKPLTNSSETHFLLRCTNAACGRGLSCICGVCSKPCSDDATCSGLRGDAECVASQDQSCSAASICDKRCERDSDCTALGGRHTCAAGRCRAPEQQSSAGCADASCAAGPTSTGDGTSIPASQFKECEIEDVASALLGGTPDVDCGAVRQQPSSAESAAALECVSSAIAKRQSMRLLWDLVLDPPCQSDVCNLVRRGLVVRREQATMRAYRLDYDTRGFDHLERALARWSPCESFSLSSPDCKSDPESCIRCDATPTAECTCIAPNFSPGPAAQVVCAAPPAGGDARAEAACDHLFAATYSRACGGPQRPPAELARMQLRYKQACLNQAAAPLSGWTPPALEACASALEAIGCRTVPHQPAACDFHGGASGGAVCSHDADCQSGVCDGNWDTSLLMSRSDNVVHTWRCGSCRPVLGVGEACQNVGCGPGAICLPGSDLDPNNGTCTELTEGEEGAVCNGAMAPCKPGLYCADQVGGDGRCTPLGAAGASCPTSRPEGCQAPLACSETSSTCQELPSVGATCHDDLDCAPGLACNTANNQCATVTWAAAGEPCDNVTTRCLVDQCHVGRFTGVTPICPVVIADGEPCTAQNDTCDWFSECFDGVCTSNYTLMCR